MPANIPRIQQFPFELLSEIFRYLDRLQREAIVCSFVCRHWRQAALSDAHLWTMIRISEYDFLLGRHFLIADLLTRSGDCPMLVALRLRGPNVPAYYDALEEFLFNVIKPKLWKFARLFIFAPQNAWPVIISAMDGEDFPWLDMLVLRSDAVKTVYKLYNEKHERLWALPDDFPMPEVDDLPGIPVLDLVFPLPSGHHLKLANLQGVSLGNVPLPQMRKIEIAHHLPQILVNNGELSKWIFSTQHLVLAGMYVPAVGVGLDLPFEIGWDTSGDWDQPDDWDIERGFSFLPRREDPFMEIEEEMEEEEEEANAPKCTMECLELVQLSAEPVPSLPTELMGAGFNWGDLSEHDCTPFFRELVEYTTDSLEALCIRGWNPDSRIWNDFIKIFGPQTTITALNTATNAPTDAGLVGNPFWPTALLPQPRSAELSALVEFPLLRIVRIWHMCVPRSFQPADLKRLFATMPAVTQLSLAYSVLSVPSSPEEIAIAESEKEFIDACIHVLEHDPVLCPQLELLEVNKELVQRVFRH